jgi:metal-responsive CopG/Arc/MetJ family transcriptional regulator
MRKRVTISLPGPLLGRAERAAKRLGLRTRSAAIERSLELLVALDREREVEASLDAYYGTRPEIERSEERRMVMAFNRSQRRRDLDREGRE